MTEIYIFSQHDELLTALSEETGLISAIFREELNQLPSQPFTFTVDAGAETAAHVLEENQVVFRDKEGELRLYVIKEIDDADGLDGPETIAICEPAFMELSEKTVVERRFIETNAQRALTAALENTRWTGIVETDLGVATTNFFYLSAIDSIWRILEVWGGEFKDVVEFNGNRITARRIRILARRGIDSGKRFDIEHNVAEIQRTVMSYPVTAIYGRGASLPIEDDEGDHTGGYTRYIDFADVEWRKSAGDPVDKPKGQRWVGDPQALQKYGRRHGIQLLHREGIWQNGNYDEPEEVLKATWDQLQKVNKPEINYKLSVHLLESMAGYEHEKVSLGDTARAIDRNFARPIEIQARVIAIEYDLMDIDTTAVVEMGQFLSAHDYDDRLDNVVREINDNRGKWEQGAKPIGRDSYQDIEPSVPANVEAVGGYQTIQVYWSFNLNEVYVQAYELFASQVKGFLPSQETMIYRGPLNGFNYQGETNTTYYFRVRAVNYHGRPSNYSAEVSASTVRVVTDDILFGPELAERLRELNKEADIIGTDGIDLDKISKEVFDKIERDRKQYTDQEIAHVENALNQELADRAKVEDVNREINRINREIGEGKESLSKVAEDLTGVEKGINTELAKKAGLEYVDGKFQTTDGRLGNIDEKTASLETGINGINSTLTSHKTEIDTATGNIRSVSAKAATLEASLERFGVNFEELESRVVGENLITDTEKEWSTTQIASNSAYGIYRTGLTPIFEPIVDQTVTISFEIKATTTRSTGARVRVYGSNGNPAYLINSMEFDGVTDDWERRTVTTKVSRSSNQNNAGSARLEFYGIHAETTKIFIRKLKFEVGRKASPWSPAPQDLGIAIGTIDQRTTKVETDLSVIPGQISAKIDETEAIRLIGGKVDTSVYNQRQLAIDATVEGVRTSISSVNTRVDNVTGTIEAVERRTTSIEATNKGFLVDITELKNQEIGGTNLIVGTSEALFFPAQGSQYNYHRVYRNLVVDTTYTFSADVEVLAGDFSMISILTYSFASPAGSRLNVRVPIVNGRIELTFKTDNDERFSNLLVYAGISGSTGGNSLRLINRKLERGHKATAWSPAPEDMVDFPTYSARQTLLDTTIQGINGRVGATESGLSGVRNTQSQFQLDLNGFTASVRDLQSGLNGKVDNNTYRDRQTSLDSTIQGITGRVQTTENGINGLSSRVGTLELTDQEFNTRISDLATAANRAELLGKSLANGRMLRKDPTFAEGTNWVRVYNNSSGNALVMNRIVKSSDAPTKSTHMLEFVKSGGTTSPGHGGFYFGEPARTNAIYVIKFIAKIPEGTHFSFHSNARGNNSREHWLTSNSGTGKWEEYIHRIECGDSGNFSSTAFYALNGGSSTVTWHMCYATFYDMTDVDDVRESISKAETAIQQNATAITQRATVTSVDNLTGRMSTAEGRITTQAREIDLRVKSDGIVSAINVTPESIRINGALIRITGQTIIDNAVITAAMIEQGAVGTLAIANAAISRLKLQEGIITNVYIADATIDNSKIRNVSADKIDVGTLRGINITGVTVTGSTITSTNGNNTSTITGGRLEARGRYARTWLGQTRTHDTSLRLENGYFRMRNNSLDRSLYLSDFGMSTFNDGEGERGSSGSLFWWDGTYSPSNSPGITLHSDGGVVALKSEQNRVMVDAYMSANLESSQANIFFRPYRDSRPGNNSFSMSVVDEREAWATDGILYYGSDANGYASGLRFSKAESNPYVAVVDGTGTRGGNTTLDAGNVATNNITKRDGSGSVYWQNTAGGSTNNGNALRASGIRAANSDMDLYLATQRGGRVRVTNENGWNNGNQVYRNIHASEFVKESTRKVKDNIERFSGSGREIINGLTVVNYELKSNIADGVFDVKIGFIAEDSPAISTDNGAAIITSDIVTYNVKATQELSFEVEEIKDELSILRIENQLLKVRVKKLEEMVA